ncbi:MAG: ribonuclease PH, partial [Chloroflexota bacterium]
CYDEDFWAELDFNVAMTDRGEFVELQGTAEVNPFSRDTIDALLSMAEGGIRRLFEVQHAAVDTLKKD